MATRIPHSHTCFICGESNAAGLKVRFQTDGEKVWTTVRVGEPHMGYLGISHGGVLAALLDETMGWAPAIHTGRFCMAVELRVEYRVSVPIGEKVTVTGYVTDVSRRIWEGHGDIRGADGTVYVRGSGRFMPMSEAATDEVMDMLLFDEGTITREQIVAARCRERRRGDGGGDRAGRALTLTLSRAPTSPDASRDHSRERGQDAAVSWQEARGERQGGGA